WKVLTSAIYLHDIKADKKTHGKEGADFAEQLLRKLDLLDTQQINKVKDAIILHEIWTEDDVSRLQEAGLEAQILYDIDSWDAFGIKGVYRFLTIYRKRSIAYEKILKNLKARHSNLIWKAFEIKGAHRFLPTSRKRSVAYEKILKNVKARYNNLIFDATRKLAKDDYEYIKSFFTKLNKELSSGVDVSETKSGAAGVVHYIAQDPDGLVEEISRRALKELNNLERKDVQGIDYGYTIKYFTALGQAYAGLHTENKFPEDGLEVDDNKKGGYLDRGRTLADHILVPLYLANMFSVFTLPQGSYSTGAILKFMFLSPATLVSISVWGLVFLISTGWHERGHYIKAIRACTLKKSLLPDAEKNLESPFIKRLFWNIKIIMLSPLGLFPGIGRKGLTYYVEAPYNIGVAAEGPTTSRRLGIVGIVTALITIPLGVIFGIPILIYIGRVALGSGVVGMLDFFFADPGEYKKFKQQEETAKKVAEGVESEKKTTGAWEKRMEDVKQWIIHNRMQEIIRADGRKLRIPWQFRNCAMGGRHTEKQYPESNISMQEMMFMPISPANYEDAQEMTVKLQNRLKQIIEKTDGCRIMGIGLEGGLAPYITKEKGDIVPEQRLWRMAKQAIKDCGYNKGDRIDVVIALDPAASEMQNEYRIHSNQPNVIGSYRFWRATEKVDMTRDELLELYTKVIEEDGIPIISIEDGFGEDDKEGWRLIMKRYKYKLFLIGDDSDTTKDSSIEYGADNDLRNAFLIKANQIGTLCETLLAILVTIGKKKQKVVSHRSKSPNDDMEAQIAMACDAEGIKAGGGNNTERLVKYVSIMETVAEAIEEKKEKLAKEGRYDEDLEGSLEDIIKRMFITNVIASEVPTNAGIPTVGVKIFFGTNKNRKLHVFPGATPLGTSAGKDESIHLVDSVIYRDQIPEEKHLSLFEGVPDGSYRFKKNVQQSEIDAHGNKKLKELYRRAMRYEGKGCLNAVDNVNTLFRKVFMGKKLAEIGSLVDVDRQLLALEKDAAIRRGQLSKQASRDEQIEIMQRKGMLGMNAILSQSLAMGRLIAHMQRKELNDILRETLMETMAKTIAANGG
ncbi:MAG: hypothetical protein JSV93_00460, partial [Candidatus Omnitrophota bacterium]